MIKLTDTEQCIFSFEGTEYRLPMTIKEVKEQCTSGYVEVPQHPYHSIMREKEIDDVEQEEIEEYIMSQKENWKILEE